MRTVRRRLWSSSAEPLPVRGEGPALERKRWGIALFVPTLWVGLLWMMYLWGSVGGNEGFYWLGIYPRAARGLAGVLLAPLLHSGAGHALANTVPLLVLGTLLFRFYPARAAMVIGMGWLLGGFAVWLLGRPSYHVGASGVVYAMAAFIVVAGLLGGQRPLAAISLLVIFLYGSMVWGLLPREGSMSWESHAAGAAAGVFVALAARGPRRAARGGNGVGYAGAYDFSAVTHTGPSDWNVTWSAPRKFHAQEKQRLGDNQRAFYGGSKGGASQFPTLPRRRGKR